MLPSSSPHQMDPRSTFFDVAQVQQTLFSYQFPARQPADHMDPVASRPAVFRASSVPDASISAPILFVESSRVSISRPSVARGCSDSVTCPGVLGRRRRAGMFNDQLLPTNLVLDLAHLPKTLGPGCIRLLESARRAITEPRGFDWQHVEASPKESAKIPQARIVYPHSLPPLATASNSALSTTSQSPCNKRTVQETKARIARYWNKPACSYEDEWDWALSGNARATTEAIRGSPYTEKHEAVHDIWAQLPDWVGRRPSLGGRDADRSLRGPAIMSGLGSLTVAESA